MNCEQVKNGEIGFCACNPCLENEGDCDNNYQCREGLRCKSDSCKSSLGFDSTMDCCQIVFVGDENFCTSADPCGVDEGHCDGHIECRNDLVCGSSNCPDSLGVSSEIDCCEPKGI